jgi:hypothetical protein
MNGEGGTKKSFVLTAVPPVVVTEMCPEVAAAETVPCGVLTVIGPVVAPAGTVTMSCVALEALTVAGTPLNRTLF